MFRRSLVRIQPQAQKNMNKSLVNIYLKMFSVLKPEMNLQQCCDALKLENVWGTDVFTPTKAIELFITYANQQVTGTATYVFGGGKTFDVSPTGFSPMRRIVQRAVKVNRSKIKRCRKQSIASKKK